jgi:cell division inhibitor SepF
MSVIDKFLSAMKMNDDDGLGDDDYLDDAYEEEYEDYEEEKPKRRILRKSYEEEEEPAPVKKPVTPTAPESVSKPKAPKAPKQTKISPIRPKHSGGMEVCVIRPKSIDEEREITETLLDGCTVVLNMEGLDLDVAQRIIDFASGSCYAVHGNLQKISNYIFIITPESVDISGDFQEMLNGVVDVPAFGTRF